MGQIEWGMWANEQAVVSGVCLLLGSIIGAAGGFKNWEFAAFSVFSSIILLLLEWPRSKRKRGNTIERKFQIYLTKLLRKMMPVSSNYYARFILHMLISVPCCFLLPTIMGGISLMVAAIIYLVAAIKREEWTPAGLEVPDEQPSRNIASPPLRPPPRGPQHSTQPPPHANVI